MMTDSPFYKVINDFLEDRLTAFLPEKMDQVYAAKSGAVEQLEEKLLSLLPVSMDATFGSISIHQVLTGLNDTVSKFKEKLQVVLSEITSSNKIKDLTLCL
jgi:hypothetical protein